MNENIEQMRERHRREVVALQNSCKHETSKRIAYMWAPGHSGNDIEVCDLCRKVLKTYRNGRTVRGKGAERATS